MPGLTQHDLEAIFTYHPPQGDQADRYVQLRAEALELATLILDLVPDSAERTLAIRHVQQAVMFANAGIAIHGG